MNQLDMYLRERGKKSILDKPTPPQGPLTQVKWNNYIGRLASAILERVSNAQ